MGLALPGGDRPLTQRLGGVHPLLVVPLRGPRDDLHDERHRVAERRFRRATRQRGHFPNDASALKVLYFTIHERKSTGGNAIGRVRNWKQVLNTLLLHYGDRIIDNQ